MEILIPEPRRPARRGSWLWAAALCVPPLAVWALIGLEVSGVSRAVGDALASMPTILLAVIALGCPLAAGVISSIAVARDRRAGLTVDRRQLALAVAGFVLAAVTASAAWARGS
jgi:hypothetical protein